jgi:hypothetical protein
VVGGVRGWVIGAAIRVAVVSMFREVPAGGCVLHGSEQGWAGVHDGRWAVRATP